MESANNLFQLLEIAAAQKPGRGLFIDIPLGLDRETTVNSNYDPPKKTKVKPELRLIEDEQSEDGEESEHDSFELKEQHKYPDRVVDAGWTQYWKKEGQPKANSYNPKKEETLLPKMEISYKRLLRQVKEEAPVIEGVMEMLNTSIILIYTDNDLDAIHWFWTVVCAGGIPCLCTKLPEDPNQRSAQIDNLKVTLNDPIILTSRKQTAQFQGVDGLRIYSFYSIEKRRVHYLGQRGKAPPFPSSLYHPGHLKDPSNLAVLMLTSGSTGNPKAVCLTHYQILSSVRGKSDMHLTTSRDVFLNWTAFDHVAHLIEIHLHAIYVGATQVTIPAEVVLSNPISFLQRIDKHRVSYTFAPNFFLGLLVQKFPSFSSKLNPGVGFDLSCLRALISGGEAKVVDTCVQLTRYLAQLGASPSVIRPGFGMTETCAGSIYNPIDCPDYDLQLKNQFPCLGYGIRGIELRFSEDGELLLRGAVVFQGYYNNNKDTRAAFVDGWFKTGDLGYCDAEGRLHLTGRNKDQIIVNGINHHPQGIENSIEDARILGVVPTFTVAFGVLLPKSHTESVIIVYLPEGQSKDATNRVRISTSISKAVVTYCGARPHRIIPLDGIRLQKSSLGKISRAKLQKSFVDGDLQVYVDEDVKITNEFASVLYTPAESSTEKTILRVLTDRFSTSAYSIGINHNLFDLGASSLDVFGIKVDLQGILNIKDIPITTFFANPVVSDLAKILDSMALDQIPAETVSELSLDSLNIHGSDDALATYNPVVVLNRNGEKTPIFFFHPGVGEVMIFLNISRYFTDRPVYALRARGFNGEPFFTCFNDIVTTYTDAIRKVQPHGPYSFVGYSFGSVVAFEIVKYLQYLKEEVKFFATIDQPLFFKARAKSYDWYECVLTLAFFLGFLLEDYAYTILPEMRYLDEDEVLKKIFSKAPKARVNELNMTPEKLDNWARLALQLKKCISGWDPIGKVQHMDVFYCEPLLGLAAATSTKEWLKNHMMKWDEFVEGGANYHEVGGTHRTLISPPHLSGFWKVFKKVMDDRGL